VITVQLCCNDERGHHTGRLEGVVFGDHDLVLEPMVPMQMSLDLGGLRVGRARFACRDWARCVGNVFWDSVSMEVADAKRLASLLIDLGWFVNEHADGSAFEELLR